MGLRLLVGPANAGKVARLLECYLDDLRAGREPVLIVPNRSDVDRVERELLLSAGAIVGGAIGTFDDVFERLARAEAPVADDAQTTLLLRRAVAGVPLNGHAGSAASSGFVEALREAVRELGAGLVPPERLEGSLGQLYASYLCELDRVEMVDRASLRASAVERLTRDFEAWGGQPVFAYGFEDLTEAEWELLRALAGRAEVTVSLPYEAGRVAFGSLQRTAEDLSSLADGRIELLTPRYGEVAQPALAHLERALFTDAPPDAPPLDGAIRFFEAAGVRGALELVADEILELVRGGTAPERIGVVFPTAERWRLPLETAFSTIGVPYALEGSLRLPQTPLGQALLALLRFAWLGGERGELFAYLRSPFSGLRRGSVDFVEGRLRGRAITSPERVDAEMQSLRDGAPLPALERLRHASGAIEAVRELAAGMLRAAYELERPPVGDTSCRDLRAYEAVWRLLDQLDAWERTAGSISREEVVAALERADVREAAPAEPGRVAVLDLMRARTRRFDVVFLLGLEEGSLPRRGAGTPFLDEEERRRLGGRLQRPDAASRDRYLFYTACTRPSRRLYLVREAATEEGTPREPSPFWEEVVSLFTADDVARWTRRRPLSALTWPVDDAPTERERLRAVSALTADERTRDAAEALARVNGWERRLQRARGAWERPTRLRHPRVLEELRARTTFNVTELERFADCSAAWFVDRVLDPKTIDAQVDPKLRGSVAHSALYKFFSGLPRELGSDSVAPEQVGDAVAFMRRCLAQALEGVRMEMTPMQRRELEGSLRRDLERLVRDEVERGLPLVPRQFEVSFGSERSAPELQRGLDLGGVSLSGKIDRIDVDPFSARGIVQDYKAGKSAHSAREIERELRLQIPLYMLVLRDLVGVEPLGGVYRPLSGARRPRGLLRAEAREDGLPGLTPSDYLPEDEFWGQVEGARSTALRLAERIRDGDVRHDPKGGDCPPWCDLWPMCRVSRS